jgi:hypothetical protein
MPRLLRALLPIALAVACAPASALGAARMWVGFQDDPSFRWEPNKLEAFDQAREANATIVRVTVYWSRVARQRPLEPANPFDPAYAFDELDEFVRNAQQRGLEVLMTIWGTPRWANGGRPPNRLPTRIGDVRAFAQALASRYSGRHSGLPYVSFYSVWNEPNLQLFLAPQFDARGRSVGPALYAKLYRAAYAGLKIGNPAAVVAIGETSARGRDRPIAIRGLQQTHSPGRFAELLSRVRPRLRFDAWAHHPYPTTPAQRPAQRVRWPNVSLGSLARFGSSLERWFGRTRVPIWITEYGHETRPRDPRGISYATQSRYLAQAFALARRDPRVEMFVWFILQDSPNNPWDSGLVAESGALKPAFVRFATLARPLDARNAIVVVRPRPRPYLLVSGLPIGFYSQAGSVIGITYTLVDGPREPAMTRQTAALLRTDSWFGFHANFTPRVGRSYVVRITASDINGNEVRRTLTLVCRRTPILQR